MSVKDRRERLDLRGLKCPMPALLVKRRLRAGGDTILEIRTDDPMAPIDIAHMCHGEGHEVVEMERMGMEARMVLRARRSAA